VSVRPSVRPFLMLFQEYLCHALTDFHQTFASSASWDRDEVFSFWDQKVKGQGHSMTKRASWPELVYVDALVVDVLDVSLITVL